MHNANKGLYLANPSKALGKALSAGAALPKAFAKAMRRLGYQAAHIVPVGRFLHRSASVQKAIADSQAILNRFGIKMNSSANGFWAKAGHLGSHSDKFFFEMGRILRSKTNKREVLDGLLQLKQMLQRGDFI